jgi:predicted GNAT family acetyltransferase
MEFAVQRDDAAHRYSARIDGHDAHIDFTPAGANVLDFRHTEVAAELRGHGVADTLVRQALNDVRAHGERIIATCPFVKKFLARHADYQDLVVAR